MSTYYVLTPSPDPRPFKISTTRALRKKNGGNALIVLENQNCISVSDTKN